MAGGVDSVAAADVPMETNLEPETVIGIKRERPIRKAAATASQRIIDLSSPTKKSSPTKNSTPTKSTVVLGEDDTLNTGSTTVLREEDTVINKKKKRTSVVTCVEEPWEAAAIMKKDSKNLSRLVAKYKGKLFRDKVKKVWEDRVIIGVLWKSEHDQYIVNTDLTTGMDEAEYDIFSVRELII